MIIENSVSNVFYLCSSIVLTFSIAAYPVRFYWCCGSKGTLHSQICRVSPIHIHMFPYNVWLTQSAALAYNRLSQRIINLKETYGPAFVVNFLKCLNGCQCTMWSLWLLSSFTSSWNLDWNMNDARKTAKQTAVQVTCFTHNSYIIPGQIQSPHRAFRSYDISRMLCM